MHAWAGILPTPRFMESSARVLQSTKFINIRLVLRFSFFGPFLPGCRSLVPARSAPPSPSPIPSLLSPFLYQPRSPRQTSGVGSQQTSTQKRIDEKQNAHLGQGILLSHISNKAEDTTVSFFFPHTGGGLLQQKGHERRRHDTATTPSRPLVGFSPTPTPTPCPPFYSSSSLSSPPAHVA